MSTGAQTSALEPGLDAAARSAIAQSAERATRSGRTRWIAWTREADVPDAITCRSRIDARDRFLWQCGVTGDACFAWGVADEIESAGPARFEDVASWRRDVAGRLDAIGAARHTTAPLFFGGFGFESESRGREEWKGFPAARFVLPEAIVEPAAAASADVPERPGRWVAIVRVEPGARVDLLVAELERRRARFAALQASRAGGDVDGCAADTALLSEAEVAEGAWPAGPEYRVRSDRPHDVFCRQVERALADFEADALEKVVLARSLTVDHDGRFDVPLFLDRLRGLYPTCALVAVGRGDDTFLAATPETLVRVRGAIVETAALAGSAPRGRDPQEDRALGDGLLASGKERVEHAHVVEGIRDALAESCITLDVPETPSLRRLFGIQHLETPIRGRLAGSGAPDVLELVARLHPTPAVGGVPRAAAQAWIQRFEGLDRGWYAAPVGWLDAQGGGDFRVALRSGLIRNGARPCGGSLARLFAGAGLVSGSDPTQELAETRVKLRALLAPLTEI